MTITAAQRDVLQALADHYHVSGIDEVPFTHNDLGWIDIAADETTVRLADDDGELTVYILTNGRAQLLSAQARFSGMPAALVAQTIAHHIDAALA